MYDFQKSYPWLCVRIGRRSSQRCSPARLECTHSTPLEQPRLAECMSVRVLTVRYCGGTAKYCVWCGSGHCQGTHRAVRQAGDAMLWHRIRSGAALLNGHTASATVRHWHCGSTQLRAPCHALLSVCSCVRGGGSAGGMAGPVCQRPSRTCTSSNRCGCAIASCTFACVHRPHAVVAKPVAQQYGRKGRLAAATQRQSSSACCRNEPHGAMHVRACQSEHSIRRALAPTV